jgi:hypothetical protein
VENPETLKISRSAWEQCAREVAPKYNVRADELLRKLPPVYPPETLSFGTATFTTSYTSEAEMTAGMMTESEIKVCELAFKMTVRSLLKTHLPNSPGFKE